jgi:hypothetical protein
MDFPQLQLPAIKMKDQKPTLGDKLVKSYKSKFVF